jgi:hypothetical protein
MNRSHTLGAVCAALIAGLSSFASAQAAEAVFPLASRIGLVPPAGMTASRTFPGFEDTANNVYIRLVTLPGPAFAEIERTMTADALKKQGMIVQKRERLTLPTGKALLMIARQEANGGRIRKWLLIAPIDKLTAMVSLEVPEQAVAKYPESEIRKVFASLAMRETIPVDEQLALVPFRLDDIAGLRLVRVVPGVAVQLTDGPNDTIDSGDQAHLVVSIAAGGPQQLSDRDSFARLAFTGLPPLKDMRLLSAESMRVAGMPGHELRAVAKDPKSGAEVEIVQWLRFGTGAYMRILGFGPRQTWAATFTRFRAVRDGLEGR